MRTFKLTLNSTSESCRNQIENELERILGNAQIEVDVLYKDSNDTLRDFYIRTEEQFCVDELSKYFDLLLAVDPRRLGDSMSWVIIGEQGYWIV